MSTPRDSLVLALDGHLKRLAPALGWDAARAFVGPKDPAGKIRLGYVSTQGTFLVHVDDAQPYLEWLTAGNRGSIVKWAQENGRRLR